MNKNAQIVEKVYRLHLNLVRKLNDSHIFIHQSLPLLEESQEKYKASTHNEDRTYFVPSISKSKIARRTDKELKEIYQRFITREIFENFIVNAISQVELYIFEVLKIVIQTYPKKIKDTVQGVEANKQIPIDIVLDSEDIENLINILIDRRLHTVSYASPKAYLDYFSNITGIDVSDSVFTDYIELKATRDLLIHNSGRINDVYVSKVGNNKRGECGELISVTAEYFDHCISTLKRVSGIIERNIKKAFPNKKNQTTEVEKAVNDKTDK